jgi:UDP-N-acetylglucosamine 2-epimerase (non-hydrolysing)
MPIIMSTHPRTAKRLEEYGLKANELINFHKPFGYFDFNKLQREAFCVISDSGSIHEESAAMDFPAVQMRVSSERPEAFDEGVAILAGRDRDSILLAIDVTVEERTKGVKMNVPRNYRDTNVSSKVLRHIVGLTRLLKKKRAL